MKKNTAYSLLILSAIGLGLAAGCSDPEYPTAVPATGPSTYTAQVSFINASPDASLQGQLNNANAGPTLNLGTFSGYATSQVGPVEITITGAAGAAIGGTLGTTNLLARPSLLKSTSYTYIVTDTIARPKGTGTDIGGLRFLTITDVLTPPTAGNAGVRFYNLAPGLASVYVTSVPAGISFSGIAYRSPTTGTFPSSVAGATTYTIQVRTGSAIGPVVASTNLDAVAGKLYTVFVKGRPGKTGAQALGVGIATNN